MKSASSKFTLGLMLLIFGGIFALPTFSGVLAMLHEPVDIYEADMEDYKRFGNVEIDLTVAYDYLISETTTRTQNGRTISSSESGRYYAVPVFDSDRNSVWIDHLVIVKVNSNQFGVFDKAVRAFDKWWEDETGSVPFPTEVLYSGRGTVTALGSKQRGYIENYFDDPNWEEYVVPYVVELRIDKNVRGMFIGGTVTMALGVVFLILAAKRRKVEKAEEAARKAERMASGYYDAPEGVTFNNGRDPENVTFDNR